MFAKGIIEPYCHKIAISSQSCNSVHFNYFGFQNGYIYVAAVGWHTSVTDSQVDY